MESSFVPVAVAEAPLRVATTRISVVMPTTDYGGHFGMCARPVIELLWPDLGDELIVVFDGEAPSPPGWLAESSATLVTTGRHAGPAETFWSGCGAMRTGAFLDLGGFDTGYREPVIEDIKLGSRAAALGAPFQPWALVPALAALVAILLMNRDFYALCARQGGPAFAAGCVILHRLYFTYATLTLAAVAMQDRVRRIWHAKRDT